MPRGALALVAAVLLLLTMGGPVSAESGARQVTSPTRGSGIDGGADPAMPDTLDPGPGGSTPSTAATSPTTPTTVSGSTPITPLTPGVPATAAPGGDPAGATTATTAVNPPPSEPTASSTPGQAPVEGSEATGGEADGAAVGTTPTGSTGGVKSPLLVAIGVAMTLGGIAFLVVRNRTTPA